MKGLITKIKNTKDKVKNKLLVLGGTIFSTLAMAECRVYAADTSSIDSFIDFACDWLTKIGGVVALVGGVMFALGWQREDAERKIERTYDIDGWIYVGGYRTV